MDSQPTTSRDRASGKAAAYEGKRRDEGPFVTRRALCIGAGATAVLLGIGGLGALGRRSLVRPPGAQDEDLLLSSCIRCGRCLEVCPRGIIRPAHIEDGFVGVRAPYLDFSEGWCDWCAEANAGHPLCSEVCPTGAIRLEPSATQEGTLLGVAVLDREFCLAYRLTGCRFCYDACEFEAIELDGEQRPIVIEDACNGCGACESVCVSLQNGSIGQGSDKRAITVIPAEMAGEGSAR